MFRVICRCLFRDEASVRISIQFMSLTVSSFTELLAFAKGPFPGQLYICMTPLKSTMGLCIEAIGRVENAVFQLPQII